MHSMKWVDSKVDSKVKYQTEQLSLWHFLLEIILKARHDELIHEAITVHNHDLIQR